VEAGFLRTEHFIPRSKLTVSTCQAYTDMNREEQGKGDRGFRKNMVRSGCKYW